VKTGEASALVGNWLISLKEQQMFDFSFRARLSPAQVNAIGRMAKRAMWWSLTTVGGASCLAWLLGR
jgi:hypothetical protein